MTDALAIAAAIIFAVIICAVGMRLGSFLEEVADISANKLGRELAQKAEEAAEARKRQEAQIARERRWADRPGRPDLNKWLD